MIPDNLFRGVILFTCGVICGAILSILCGWMPMLNAKAATVGIIQTDKMIEAINRSTSRVDLMIHLIEREKRLKEIISPEVEIS